MAPQTNRRWTVIALLCAVFLAAMEATVVATVMPTIVGQLGGLDHYAWVFTAYMMSATVTVPIYGKLADLFGRKPILQFGIFLFLIGSLLSAFATSMNQLIFFRAIQGLGAGAIQPMGLTIIGDLFKIQERAKVTAVFGTVWGVAGVFGPMIGGLILKFFGWPWIFLINLPFGITAGLLLQKSLVEDVKKQKVQLDWLGAFFLSATIISALLAVNDPQEMIFIAPLSALLFVAFLLTEQRAAEPIVPLEIFSNPVISIASLVSIMLGGAMLCFVTFLPLYVQGVMGLSVFDAGLSIIPMGISWPIASGYSARILPRIGFRTLLRLGLSLVVFGCATVAFNVLWSGPFFILCLGMACLGLGMGFSNVPLLFSVQTSVDWNRRGSATASTLFFRTIGGTIAVGVMGGVLSKAFKRDPSLPMNIANDLLGPTHGINISQDFLQKLSHILDWGLHRIFLYSTGIALFALLFGLAFPKISREGKNEDL